MTSSYFEGPCVGGIKLSGGSTMFYISVFPFSRTLVLFNHFQFKSLCEGKLINKFQLNHPTANFCRQSSQGALLKNTLLEKLYFEIQLLPRSTFQKNFLKNYLSKSQDDFCQGVFSKNTCSKTKSARLKK